jgi:hypothetical protein|tara:strand:+ start:42 stop:761 length:720 start_codon:yes stop_codon:yes gene_type:complete
MKKAEAVQKLINESHLAIGEICSELEVSRFIVHKWRSGESNPRRENLNKLAKMNNVNLKWLSNHEVIFENIPLTHNSEAKRLDNDFQLDKIIHNQLDLIDILKNDNSKLKNNLKKFQLSKQIFNNHDYSITRDIDDQKIINIKVPSKGLLGYTKKEFIKLSKMWPISPLFDPKVSIPMKEEEKKRVNTAKDLGIEHFDISNHILYNGKKADKTWGYFIKYYDFKLNIIQVYVKFLDAIN